MSRLRGFLAVGSLLAASAALADPIPDPAVPTREVVTRAPAEPRALEDEVQTLARTVAELRAEVARLRTVEAERPKLYDVGDPNEHKLWP